MGLRQRARDRQSEPAAVRAILTRRRAAKMPVEHPRQITGGDADAFVAHLHPPLARRPARGRDADLDGARGARIVDRVVEQDQQQLAQALLVGEHQAGLVGRYQRQQANAERLGERARLRERIGAQGGEIERPALEREPVEIAARHQQQVVDHIAQLARGLDDARQCRAVLRGRAVHAAQGDLRLAANRGGGCAQLMADVGEQLAPPYVGLLQGFQRPAQLGRATRDFVLQPLALLRLAPPVQVQLACHRVHAARDRRELVVAVQRNAVRKLALLQCLGAVAQLGERPTQRAAEIQRGRQPRERKCQAHREPQGSRAREGGVGAFTLASHRLLLARLAVGDQKAQVSSPGLLEYFRQRPPRLQRIDAGRQRLHVRHRGLELPEVLLEHRQGILALDLPYPRGVGAVAHRDRRDRQCLQLLQKSSQLGLQLIAHADVGNVADLALRDPGVKALLHRGQLDEAAMDVAGHTSTLDLLLGDSQCGDGADTLHERGGGENGENSGQAASEHAAIVHRPALDRGPFIFRSSARRPAFMRHSTQVQLPRVQCGAWRVATHPAPGPPVTSVSTIPTRDHNPRSTAR